MESHLPKPHSITFFPNGLTAVCDKHGAQIPEYQKPHADSIKALADDGINWEGLPNIWGKPQSEDQRPEWLKQKDKR